MIYRIENIKDAKFTDELFCSAYSAMDSARRQKADKYKHENDRKLCVFADYILRDMLREFSVDSVQFYFLPTGKPMLKTDGVYFNISHSKNYIACAVGTKPIGIDIEAYRKITLPLVNRVCTEDEAEYVFKENDDIENENTKKRFFSVWTAKEAFLKCTGEGISRGLKSITVANKDGMKDMLTQRHKLMHISTEDYALAIVEKL